MVHCPTTSSNLLFSLKTGPSAFGGLQAAGTPRGEAFVSLSLSAKRSDTVRNWTEMDFRRAELNNKKPNKSLSVCTRGMGHALGSGLWETGLPREERVIF